MSNRACLSAALALLVVLGGLPACAALEAGFAHPPDSCRPWVYWFWLDGNITRQGITADLEAMSHVGIGGVLIMEVGQGTPTGPVAYMSPQWRALLKHAVAEARRLGLQVNINDGPGWNGSSGPWIKPEQSMQTVVWSETQVDGPRHYQGVLAQPETRAEFYRDIAVLAFPAPQGDFRLANIREKAAFDHTTDLDPKAAVEKVPPEQMVGEGSITDISPLMNADGRLTWQVPAGKWTILRFGHTSTGAMGSPAPRTGWGLECDKLSRQGIEAQFAGMLAPIIRDNRRYLGKSLVAMHIDSWENGAQNWSERMPAEFAARRGYDLGKFLPVLTGRVVGTAELSERFLWDFRQTISDLIAENYSGRLRELAHRHGLKLSIEAYYAPCDEMTYAGTADQPICEFWMPSGEPQSFCKEMSSAAHVFGRQMVGAEAFTADASERWLQHPATLKPVADLAFCQGVNQLIIHRFAHQPWLQSRPGMSMGPWGTHYERTQTWWEQTPAWHTYLARCQYLLRQGVFVADICRLRPQWAPQTLRLKPTAGYDYDECSAEVVLKQMQVRNGRLVLPSGMSYRVLELPNVPAMTPALLGKIRDLVRAGATVIGSPPARSPSLAGYPQCDQLVSRLAGELWGDDDGVRVQQRRFGLGLVVRGMTPEQYLAQAGIGADFASRPELRYIHRHLGGADLYYVSNQQPAAVQAMATFRVTGQAPELWWPDTGRIEPGVVYQARTDCTRVSLLLPPKGSVFVVFRKQPARNHIIAINGDAARPSPAPAITIGKAEWGPAGDPQRTRDVTAQVQRLVAGGHSSFQVAKLAEGGDPAYGVVKTLVVDYTVGGKVYAVSATDPETIYLVPPAALPPYDLHAAGNRVELIAHRPGRFVVTWSDGRRTGVQVPALPAPIEVVGPYQVSFPPQAGAPEQVTLDRLASLSLHPDSGVQHFSGTATYRVEFTVPQEALCREFVPFLDLGDVRVIAEARLNGRDLGTLWKPPYRLAVGGALRLGTNTLEIRVTNLWVNRMIGDEQLPEDSSRNPDGTLQAWPDWLLAGRPSPTGRITFTSWRLWRKDEQLLPSGLLGPVTITFSRRFGL